MATKIPGIYSITNKINGKVYYGSSVNTNKRIIQHKTNLNNNRHPNAHLQAAWLKYGKDAFEFKIEKELPIEQLLDVEQSYLDKAKSNPDKHYNISYSAECPMRGRKTSKESIENRMSKIRGRKHSEQSKKNMSIGMKLHMTPERRRKIGLINKGKSMSEQAKIKSSLSHKGQIPTNHDHAIYLFNNNITNEIFEGKRMDLARKYDLDVNLICAVIKGRRKSHGNWSLITK
jgi:group I intron endonuclease